MKDWQQRVVDEQAELDKRGQKLSDFINEDGGVYDSLPKDDRLALLVQLEAMSNYMEALDIRIEGFEQD